MKYPADVGFFSRMSKASLLLGFTLSAFFASGLSGESSSDESSVKKSEPAPQIGLMDTEGLDPKLARVLQNYYIRSYGGPERWEELQSVVYEGQLHYPEGTVEFVAYKKKPDLCKVVLRAARGGRIVMAYDGEQAWQYNSNLTDQPLMEMPAGEARNFIRDAGIGSHLIMPRMPGKQIKLLGVVNLDEHQCYEIEVTLPDGQRVRYALDILTYAVRREITLNNVSKLEEHNIHSEFEVAEGIRYSTKSVMRSGGEVIHRVEISDIRLNAGVSSAMFLKSSEFVDSAAEEATDPFESPQPPDSGFQSFGEAPFGSSLFPDPDDE